MAKRGRLLVISGPSGAGKSTVIDAVLRRRPKLSYSISFTTRSPRGKEKDGVEYHFVSETAFKKMIDAGEFVEWANVHGFYYGTSAVFIEDTRRSGRDILLDIDVEGAGKLFSTYPDAISVFVTPPNLDVLEKRLANRATDKPEIVKRRMKNAKGEMDHADRYDYVLVNNELEETVSRLEEIIDGTR